MTKNKIVPNFEQNCMKCNGTTEHKILCQTYDSGSKEYHCALYHMVVQCCGCKRKSFREVFYDYESAYPISDDEWEVPETVHTYPRYIEGHSGPEGLHHAPEIVQSIYGESLAAIQEGAMTLAGLGLRGTIEAICNDRNISGRNLEVRISALAKSGFISTNDARRLHAIRFLGNDAAHDILKPKQSQLDVALKIIEHLISSVYLLDAQIDGRLDTIVVKYEDFIDLLETKILKIEVGDELPLAAILQKDMRRISENWEELQEKMIEEINIGNFCNLIPSKIDKYGNWNQNLQHFIRC